MKNRTKTAINTCYDHNPDQLIHNHPEIIHKMTAILKYSLTIGGCLRHLCNPLEKGRSSLKGCVMGGRDQIFKLGLDK